MGKITSDMIDWDQYKESVKANIANEDLWMLGGSDFADDNIAELEEELAEYQESKEVEELADLLEVIAAAASARGCTWERLLAIREEKRLARGGFEEKLLLLEVSQE